MKLRTAVTPSLLALLLSGLVGSGCLRLDEPDAFRCDGSDDCLADEHCGSGGWCLAAGQCSNHIDCAETQRCEADRCVTAQCSSGNIGACGRYDCNHSERKCHTDCVQGRCQAESVCDDGVCRAPLNLPHGSVCEDARDCMSMRCCSQFGTTTRSCGNCLL